ncbi:MAG TPA: DNA topoisomerase VI, partial [Planctomycetes bacterium]|nr:DNA topoisomerase VI [Planctomycetota bacterium]
MDKITLDCIDRAAKGVLRVIEKGDKPSLRFPLRSLSNVRYDPAKGFFQLGRGRKLRTLTVNTVKVFAQSLRMMALSKELIETEDFATKRDAYYQSKNWGEARF